MAGRRAAVYRITIAFIGGHCSVCRHQTAQILNLLRILISFGIFSALMAGLTALLVYFFGTPWLHEKIWYIYFFQVAAGALFFIVNYLAWLKGDQVYVMGALAALMGRLLLSGACAAFFILGNLDNELWFVLDFMLLYLFFSVFEITVIISNLRAQKNT